MDVLSFSFDAVFPIALLILVGFFLRKVGLLDTGTAQKVNKLCFTVFIPCKLYQQVADADLRAAADPTTLAVSVGGTLLVILLLCLIVPRFLTRGPHRAEFIQGVFRGNTSILGIPLVENLYGAAATAALAMPMSIILIVYNILAPLLLVYHSGSGRADWRSIARKVATNPFLIGVVLGLAANLTGVSPYVPVVVNRTVGNLAAIGSPLALVALGATVDLAGFRRSGRLAFTAAFLRLVVISALVLVVGALCGLRQERMAVLVCFFSTPAAIGSYVLAKNTTGDGEVAGQILVLSTAMSIVTMFATIALCRAAGVM